MTEELNENAVPEVPSLADFIPEGAEDEMNVPDPNSVIRLISSGGDERYVVAENSMTIGEVMLQSDLRIVGAVQYWLNGVQADVNTVVAPGSTVTIVGSVKGG